MPRESFSSNCECCIRLAGFDMSLFENAVLSPDHRFRSSVAEEYSPEKLAKSYEIVKEFRRSQGIEYKDGIQKPENHNVGYISGIISFGSNQFAFDLISVSDSNLLRKKDRSAPLNWNNYRIITGNRFKEHYLYDKVFEVFSHKPNVVKYRRQDTEYRLLAYVTEKLFDTLSEEELSGVLLNIEKKNWNEVWKITDRFEGLLEGFTEKRICELCDKTIRMFSQVFRRINARFGEGVGQYCNVDDLPKTTSEVIALRNKVAFGDHS
jgi:hypothetical protein